MSEKTYPDLSKYLQEDDSGHITLDDKDLQKLFYNDRYNLMVQKKEEMTSTVKRYMKSKKHYSLANNIQKIVSLVVTSSLTIATIVLTSGLAVPIFLIPTASGLSLFFLGFTSSIDKLVKTKKLRIKSKLDNLQTLIAKMEVYIEKAREDGSITPEEVNKFNNLLEIEKKKNLKISKKEKLKLDENLQAFIEEVITRNINKR